MSKKKKPAPWSVRHMLTPNMLAKEWHVPRYIVCQWFEKEPGVVFWERQSRLGKPVRILRIPPEVAERVRLRHINGGAGGGASVANRKEA